MFGRIALYSIFVCSIVGLFAIFALVELGPRILDSLPALTFAPKEVSAPAWGVFDPETGEILAGENLDEVHSIASLTKLFTAFAVMESEEKHERFTILVSDVYPEGRAGKLVAGAQMTQYELLFPLLLESSNDAAEAIHRTLRGGANLSFLKLKEEIPLPYTAIVDTSGLSPENVSTVRELASLFMYLEKNQPHILDITKLNMYINVHAGYINNNPARTLPVFMGGKHGYTPEAGRTFVGAFTTATPGKEVGIILLGSEDILADLEKLLGETPSFKAYF